MSARQNPNGSAGVKGQGTTIGDIPEEVLVYIFDISLRLNLLNRTSTLCRLRLICRWWEQVIQRTPSLWSKISSLDGPKWTQLASERSEPLLLTADITGISKHAAIVAVDRELQRAESLSVILPFRHYAQQSPGTFPNLHQSAPQTLRSLSLSTTGFNSQYTWVIFGGQWTHLQSLQIVQVNLDWDFCRLSRLERLEITGTDFSHPTLPQLFHVLGSCPDLRYARLLRVGLDVGANPPSGVITLRKLTTLILSCPTESTTQLLLKAQIPNCRHFEFREDIRSSRRPPSPWGMLDALMLIVDTRSVQPGPTNTALYFPNQQELVIQCQLESPSSVTGLQFNLHLKRTSTGKDLKVFKESDLWRVLEYGGLVIRNPI